MRIHVRLSIYTTHASELLSMLSRDRKACRYLNLFPIYARFNDAFDVNACVGGQMCNGRLVDLTKLRKVRQLTKESSD